MAFEWTDRVNFKDYNLAEDVNTLGHELLRVGSIADNTETNLTTEKTERMSEDNILSGEITELREVVESFGEPPLKLSDCKIPNEDAYNFGVMFEQGDKVYILNDVGDKTEFKVLFFSEVYVLTQPVFYGKKYIFEFVKMISPPDPSIEDRNGLINVTSVDLEDIAEDISTLKTQVNQNSTDLIQEYEERTKADSLLHSLLTKARIYDYLTAGTWAGSQFVDLPVGTEFVILNSSYDPIYPNEEITYTKFYVNDERAYTLSASIEPNKAYKCKIISQVDVSIDGHDGEIEVIGEFTDSDAYNEINNKLEIISAPINHRNIFRGKNLGSTVTEAQKTAIQSGTFDDLFVGDYWEIDGINWRIVDMDYWENIVTPTGKIGHHLVLMPDTPLYQSVMNDTPTTDNGYQGSKMYTTGLEEAKNLITETFGDMIIPMLEILTFIVQDGKPISTTGSMSQIQLPDEIMVSGTRAFSPANDGKTITALETLSRTQLALLRLSPSFTACGSNYWTKDVASAERFIYVTSTGNTSTQSANKEQGVRPVFAIG